MPKQECQSQKCRSAPQSTTSRVQPKQNCLRCGFSRGHNPFAELQVSCLRSIQKVHESCRAAHRKFRSHLQVSIYLPPLETLCCQLYFFQETHWQVCLCEQVHYSGHTPRPHQCRDEPPNASLREMRCQLLAGRSPQVCHRLFELLPATAANACHSPQGWRPTQRRVLRRLHQACRCLASRQRLDPKRRRMSRHKSCEEFLVHPGVKKDVASNSLLRVLVPTSCTNTAIPN